MPKFERPRPGRFAADVQAFQKPLAKALTMAFREGAKQLQSDTRAAIIASGLNPRFARQFKAFGFPRKQYSLAPALRGWHARGWRGSKIGRFANIFATGGTIRAKAGYLWVPLPTMPRRIAGKAPTPALYNKEIGPLFRMRGTRRPILAGHAARGIRGRRATEAQLKTGARRQAMGRKTVAVPMFVGVSAVRIPQRVNMDTIFAGVLRELPVLFEKQMERA